jgi:hypothetical protein
MKNLRTFVSSEGTVIQTADKSEIKRLKACGWLERKSAKQVFAKGLENGKSYLN